MTMNIKLFLSRDFSRSTDMLLVMFSRVSQISFLELY